MQIKELNILTADLPGTRLFYESNLGLKISSVSAQHVQYTLKESLMSFNIVEGFDPVYHIAFNIPSNKIQEGLEWLENKAVIIPVDDNEMIADFKNWNAHSVYFFDNNRNILEFIARDDLHNDSDQHFNAESILSVSEIGIVTPHVESTCQQLKDQFGLDYFIRQPPSNIFSVMGDDLGLFIVVHDKKNWYPTDIPCECQWSKIIFSQNNVDMMFETGEKLPADINQTL